MVKYLASSCLAPSCLGCKVFVRRRRDARGKRASFGEDLAMSIHDPRAQATPIVVEAATRKSQIAVLAADLRQPIRELPTGAPSLKPARTCR